MAGGHHPRSTIEHRTEVVAVPKLGLPCCNAHPHRQFQGTLRGHRGIDGRLRRGEGGTHPVAGVLEHEAAVCLNRGAQHLVMDGQCCPHLIRVRLPPTGRPLDIGEQKSHHPRRSSRREHAHRISQGARGHLEHHWNRSDHPSTRTARRVVVYACAAWPRHQDFFAEVLHRRPWGHDHDDHD